MPAFMSCQNYHIYEINAHKHCQFATESPMENKRNMPETNWPAWIIVVSYKDYNCEYHECFLSKCILNSHIMFMQCHKCVSHTFATQMHLHHRIQCIMTFTIIICITYYVLVPCHNRENVKQKLLPNKKWQCNTLLLTAFYNE